MSRQNELKNIQRKVTTALVLILEDGRRKGQISLVFKKCNNTGGRISMHEYAEDPYFAQTMAQELTTQFGTFSNLTSRQAKVIARRAEVDAARQLDLV